MTNTTYLALFINIKTSESFFKSSMNWFDKTSSGGAKKEN